LPTWLQCGRVAAEESMGSAPGVEFNEDPGSSAADLVAAEQSIVSALQRAKCAGVPSFPPPQHTAFRSKRHNWAVGQLEKDGKQKILHPGPSKMACFEMVLEVGWLVERPLKLWSCVSGAEV